jgi:hypothetical protein
MMQAWFDLVFGGLGPSTAWSYVTSAPATRRTRRRLDEKAPTFHGTTSCGVITTEVQQGVGAVL